MYMNKRIKSVDTVLLLLCVRRVVNYNILCTIKAQQNIGICYNKV